MCFVIGYDSLNLSEKLFTFSKTFQIIMCINDRINFVRFILWLSIGFACSRISIGKSCDVGQLFQCGQNETCKEDISHQGTATCECLLTHVRKDGVCVPSELPNPSVLVSTTIKPASDQQSNSRKDFPVFVWLVVSCFTIAIVTGLVIIGRRYMWMERIYQLRIRRYNTVLINNQGDDDDDDDDPPIA